MNYFNDTATDEFVKTFADLIMEVERGKEVKRFEPKKTRLHAHKMGSREPFNIASLVLQEVENGVDVFTDVKNRYSDVRTFYTLEHTKQFLDKRERVLVLDSKSRVIAQNFIV